MKPEVCKLLTVTTAHVTDDERETWDDDHGVGDDAQWARAWAREYGWMLHVGGEREADDGDEFAGVSAGLRGVIETARALKCDWVMFDRDADALDGVETYTW